MESEKIYKGLKAGEEKVVKYIYKEFYPKMKALARNYYLTNEEAENLFQEAILIIYEKVSVESFVFTCKFNVFLFSVYQNLIYNFLKKSKKHQAAIESLIGNIDLEENTIKYGTENIEDTFYDLVKKHYLQMEQFCKDLLKYCYSDKTNKEIATLLQIKQETITNRKHLCKKRLLNQIEIDPLYRAISKD